MTSFIAVAPSGPEPVIKNHAFWPDINPRNVREAMRLDGTVTPDRLRHALIDAVFSVNNELTEWRELQTARGIQQLDQILADVVDGEHRLVYLYRRAVYCTAKASLLERYSDFDTSQEGQKKAALLNLQIDEARRDIRWAISDLKIKPRATVDLL